MSKMEYIPKAYRDNKKNSNSILAKVATVLTGMVVALGAGLYGYDVSNGPVDDATAIEYEVTAEETAATEEAEIIEETTATEEVAFIDDTAIEEISDTEASTVTEDVSVAGEPVVASVRFRNMKLLNSHYDKHGIEMGFASAQEYEQAAAEVVANPESLHKVEAEDGDDVYYLEATNDFVIVSTDGYIRTYFRPDKGKAYYDRQ